MTLFLTIWIGLGMTIDCLSCWADLRRIVKGYGPSGLSVVPLIVCYSLPLLVSQHAVFTAWWVADWLLLILFHALIVFLIPALFRRWTARPGRPG